MTFEEAYQTLLALPRFDKRGAAALKPGFARILKLLAGMGHPERACRSVLIGGTNGKGSTASALSAICTMHGLRTGLHTSPHFRRVTERMRVDGRPADEAWLAAAVSRYEMLIAETAPSFFETTVALSLLHFAEQSVDICVVEVGLGGRLDATNVLEPSACVITRIGFDHVDFLGSTLAGIAAEKAGIIKPGVPVWTTNDDPDVVAVIRNHAASVGAPFRTIGDMFSEYGAVSRIDGTIVNARSAQREYRDLFVGLRGRHQAENVLAAIAAAEHLVSGFDAHLTREALANVERLSGLEGRLALIRREPLVVADVAHNPDGVRSVLSWLAEVRPDADRISVAMGIMRDKAVADVVALLAPLTGRLFPVHLESERALPSTELATRFREAVAGEIMVEDESTAPEAIRRFLETSDEARDVLLVLGSFQVLEQLGPPDSRTEASAFRGSAGVDSRARRP